MGEILDHREFMLEEELERGQKLYERMMAEFGRIATPQEVEEGRLRMALAINFRMSEQIESLQLSEKELRDLMSIECAAKNPFQKIMELIERGTASAPRPTEYIANVRQLLGEERFTEWVCAQDEDISRFRKTTQKLGTPSHTAVKLFEVQQATLEEAEQIRNNENLSRAEKRTELRALQEISKKAVAEFSGNQVADEYFTSRVRWWETLRNP